MCKLCLSLKFMNESILDKDVLTTVSHHQILTPLSKLYYSISVALISTLIVQFVTLVVRSALLNPVATTDGKQPAFVFFPKGSKQHNMNTAT